MTKLVVSVMGAASLAVTLTGAASGGDANPSGDGSPKRQISIASDQRVGVLPIVRFMRGDSRAYFVRLASLKSESAARREWRSIRAANATIVDPADVTIEEVVLSNGRIRHRLQIGPFQTLRLAKESCAALNRNRQKCLVEARKGKLVPVRRTEKARNSGQTASFGGVGTVVATRQSNAGASPADLGTVQLAQFQLPPKTAPKTKQGKPTPAPPKFSGGELKLQYAWGTELEIPYRQNDDLDSRLSDESLIFLPSIFGTVTYRPTRWFESSLEVKLEKQFAAIETDPVTLPDGELQERERRPWRLNVEQLFGRIKLPTAPVEFTVGRRDFKDTRLWLYDTQLDAAIITVKPGNFNIEASISREDLVDLNLTAFVPQGKTNNYIVNTEYRGVEDHKFTGYWIYRDDKSGEEGQPHFLGLRASGRPIDAFNYWAELAYVTGEDEESRRLSAGAFELGGTYRFLKTPLQPSVTLGFAYGTGDKNPDDGTNTEFRQTGLQSNESTFSGVTEFKTYGEVLDPELSNLKLLTAGIGFRPAAGMFVDLVYHHYWLNEVANEIRGQALTAQMNEFGASRNVGGELDIIVGFRNLFGVRGLGFETRAGIFFPGDAWRRNDGSDPDIGISALSMFLF